MSQKLTATLNFIKENPEAAIFTVATSNLIFGFIHFPGVIYYCTIVCCAALAFIRRKSIDTKMTLFLIACALSIVMGYPAPQFNSWARFSLFILVIASVFPWFGSDLMYNFRKSIFQIYLIFIIIIGVSAPLCYVLGINYMTRYGYKVDYLSGQVGWFGGLTGHSMILGPICALSATYLTYLIFHNSWGSKMKYLLVLAVLSSVCGAFVSASRGASIATILGIIITIYFCNRDRFSKVISRICVLVLFAFIFQSVYEPFLENVMKKQEANEDSGGTFSSRKSRWMHRVEEFGTEPIFGIGFASVDLKYDEEYDSRTGVIEPGTSWLAILSMTGIFGAGCFLAIFVPTIVKLYRMSIIIDDAQLCFALLSVFVFHMITEGYIFAGGNFLCIMFWLTLGLSYSLSKQHNK
ncbi:O-antigen ligase domain-containing protein [Muribaculaceae bacterium Isolate-039 (Harlan)]|jgi:hypothetical protein|uniref:O-antigen ligase family protein n=1 Tax=Bacteroidales TaxID=171549 RepID=UPI000F485A9A|nr:MULTISPECIES: O-antigen ligase family protein [Bacteroidales]ROS85477.1 O-antigen ligase domain-containing protein [Muribaculaceae bacterium Isolate-039 (Harlan)]ROS95117.1 O-antigen ligase domain-containing protein [Muribaculaceae bacterium Isolate-077 (Janvier)]ROS97901.1 O-antigen ligase domain-containing protein [Muribaculaceae bacterium Isolate-083 (Janvier)]ROS98155.1 O-antigen ligase domain-containing protein [Muribaculaceae bacterium Isolate-084 (Janvier)]